MNYVFVMAGGFLGAMARYGISLAFGDLSFPAAAMTVNMIGCFFLSFLLTLVSLSKRDYQVWALTFGTGFLGAFTTFSTFALDILLLNVHTALLYIALSLLVGISFAGLGFWIARGVHLRLKET